MAFRWRADNGTILNAGSAALRIFQRIRTSIAKEPYSFAPSGFVHVMIATATMSCALWISVLNEGQSLLT